jgi:hypothetical protein
VDAAEVSAPTAAANSSASGVELVASSRHITLKSSSKRGLAMADNACFDASKHNRFSSET